MGYAYPFFEEEFPYIINKRAYDIIFNGNGDLNEVKLVHVNAVHNDQGDIFLEGTCELYKWGGLFHIPDDNNNDRKITFLNNMCGHILF